MDDLKKMIEEQQAVLGIRIRWEHARVLLKLHRCLLIRQKITRDLAAHISIAKFQINKLLIIQ